MASRLRHLLLSCAALAVFVPASALAEEARARVVEGAASADRPDPVPAASTSTTGAVVTTDAADPPQSETAGTPAPTASGPNAGAQADAPSVETDCNFGIAVWCFSRSVRKPNPPQTKFRLEAFAGYKASNSYYGAERRGCTAAGCSLDFTGPSFSADAFYNVAGHPHGDDYVDVGVSASYMPIVSSIKNNPSGFAGEFGRVGAGDGSLAYVPLRLTVRRSSFLFLIKSKYLVSAFGAGVAVPVTTGAGDTFTGADGLKATVGGRLGAQLPITDVMQVGLVTSWTVVWYGGVFDASFQTSYGLNLAYQL